MIENHLTEQQTERFLQLYTTYQPMIYGRTLKLTENVSQAEDFTAEVFARAYAYFPTFVADPTKPQSTSRWLNKITSNTIHAYWRKNTIREVDILEFPEHPSLAVEERGFEETEIRSQVEAAAAVTSLTEQQRRIIELRFGSNQRTIAEIANELSLTPGAVKACLHRGLEGLRTALLETI